MENKSVTIKCSRYNEVSLEAVKPYIKNISQIKKSPYANGCFLGELFLDGKKIRVYSDDEVVINDVRIPLSLAEESYYDRYLTINI